MPHLTGLAIINTRGNLVLYRAYTPEASRSAMDLFRLRVTSRARGTGSGGKSASSAGGSSSTSSSLSSSSAAPAPVLLLESTSFVHLRHHDLYFVCTTSSNANAPLVLTCLTQLVQVFKAYLGQRFDEAKIRANFALTYELLDECIDYGVPQNCSVDVLKLYIDPGGSGAAAATGAGTDGGSQLTSQITGKTDWRRPDIVHKKNEVYIDLLESVNVLVAGDGTVLKADCSGEVRMRTFLSGMPECKLTLNDKLAVPDPREARPELLVDIDDVSFHRCVRLGTFDADRSIVFIPPDGQFELLKYRIANNVTLPFRVIPVVDQTRTRVAYTVRLLCNFSNKITASNLVVRVPVPPNTFKVTAVTSFGRAKFEPGEQAVVWRVRTAAGEQEFFLNALAELSPSTRQRHATWASRPPITLSFRVNMFTASGLYVTFLRVHEASGYKPSKFVRYVTRAGSYQIRI